MCLRNRALTALLAASYMLAVTTSTLFHSHGDHDEDQPPRPGVSAAHPEHDHDCSVCQFLAQKPAPVVLVTPVSLGAPVQDVAVPAPACPVARVFATWHSRAPPVPA
jgi:hypothetical protein